MPAGPLEILLVEDNPADVRLTREALRESEVCINLHVVPDGVEAIAYLRQQGIYQSAPRPDLVLLDLNLPRKDGCSVLQEVKEDEHLKRIPIIVLTTSAADEDVVRSYDLHANSYITKPADLEHFLQVVRLLNQFWFTVAILPPK